MKTITKTYNVYTFDELSEDAKDYAHNEYLRHGDVWPWGDDAVATIKEIENLFHITLKGWEISSYRPHYPTVEFDDWWYNSWNDPAYKLNGNRARSFLWNNFGHVLMKPRTRYFYKDATGKISHGISKDSVKYVSKVSFTRVYDGTCPLTGVCFDCDALDPMAEFCFGVEWNEKAQKRTQTKVRTLCHDYDTSVESIVQECVYNMFRAFNADYEYCASRECFAETCESNDWNFTEDGEMVNE